MASRDSIQGALDILTRLGWTPTDPADVAICDGAALSPALLHRAEVCIVTCDPAETSDLVLRLAAEGFALIDVVRPVFTGVFVKRHGSLYALCRSASHPS